MWIVTVRLILFVHNSWIKFKTYVFDSVGLNSVNDTNVLPYCLRHVGFKDFRLQINDEKTLSLI